jgi:hypothetical protein
MIDQGRKMKRFLLMLFILGWMITGCTTIHPVMIEDRPSVDRGIFSNERFDKVLPEFVNERGLVNYSELRDDPGDLEAYYNLIATYSPDSHPDLFPSEKHKLAYWINAYNAGAIKTVLTYYPIGSVLEVEKPALLFFLSDKAGFFFFQRLTFGGKTTSLYYLENQIIRKRFGDPRIHFAVNCASLGCPRLPRQSFSGDFLDQQLDNEARFFLAEERNFKIDHDEKVIYLSSIFQWYEKDFTSWYRQKYPGRTASLLSYIDLYLTPEKSEELQKIGDRYRLRFIPYDWRLNDQKAFSSSF